MESQCSSRNAPSRQLSGFEPTRLPYQAAAFGHRRRDAWEHGDDAVIGAALRGPALLWEMGREQHQMLQDRYRTERHPREAARIARLTQALDGLERAGIGLLGFTDAITTTPRAIHAEQAAA